MSNSTASVQVRLVDGDATWSTDDKIVIEAKADAAIAEFDEFFQNELKNDPLTRSEKAIIKTFLHYHLVHKPNA